MDFLVKLLHYDTQKEVANNSKTHTLFFDGGESDGNGKGTIDTALLTEIRDNLKTLNEIAAA